jgi:cyanophycin synthetase
MTILDRAMRDLPALAQLTSGVVRARLSTSDRTSRRHQAAFYRALWTSAAAEAGFPVSLSGDGGGVDISLPCRTVTAHGSQCGIDTPDVLHRAGDKALVTRLLADAGLPVPPQRVFCLATLEVADAFRSTLAGTCVVKPAQDTGAGRGVTTGIRARRDLTRAAAVAAAAGARGSSAVASATTSVRPVAVACRVAGLLRGLDTVPLLIEGQVPGANYRLLYLDGELIDAIRRDAPVVVGDGQSTIGQLLDALNRSRLDAGGIQAQMLVTRDLDLERTLAEQNLTAGSVPAEGAPVPLKTTINENAPGGNRPARDELCAAIVEQGRIAAELVGARLAGVDVITTDPRLPLEDTGGCVLEVNTTPGLAMHYHGHEGATAPATEVLLRLAARPFGVVS